MKKPALLLASALLAAGSASAQVQRISWDSPSFGTPSVRDLVQGQPAPAAPFAAPKAAAGAAAAENPAPAAKCPDAPALDGRAMNVTLDVQGRDKPLSIVFSIAACVVEYPRDEPPAPPYTRRTYLSATGDVLNVYSSSDLPTSTVSIRLADGNDVANVLPILSNDELASGRPIDLGVVLLVKLKDGKTDGVLTHATGSIKSVPTR